MCSGMSGGSEGNGEQVFNPLTMSGWFLLAMGLIVACCTCVGNPRCGRQITDSPPPSPRMAEALTPEAEGGQSPDQLHDQPLGTV